MKNGLRLLQALMLVFLLAACGNSGPGESAQPPAQAKSQAEPPATAKPPPACSLVMGWDPWEPYQYEIAGGQVFGLDVDLLTAVVRNAGCEISFRKGSWRELLQLLRDGEIDLLAGATRTTSREEFARFTESYRDEEFYLYVSSDRLPDLEGQSFEQLLQAGMRLGVIDDYLYPDSVASFQDQPDYEDRFVYTSMAEINISQLLDGQVDGIIDDKFVGAAVIRHKNLAGAIQPLSMRFGATPVSIMVSRASVDEALFGRLNQSVRELRKNGAIDKILAQYLNP